MCRYILIVLIFVLNYSVQASKNPFCALPCGNITHACCKFKHSKPGPNCRSPYTFHKMTTEDRKLVLAMHNTIRNNVASGTNPLLTHPSSNMQALVYDLELEFLASCWSTQCRKKRYGCLDSKRGPTSHSIWHDKEKRFGRSSARKVLIQTPLSFYKHLETINRKSVNNFRSINLSLPHLLLSQILWAKTQRVGCSRVTFGTNTKKYKVASVVCVYYPKGNIESQPIYKIGEPCSDCPKGSYCDKNLTSLCAQNYKRAMDGFNAPFEITASARRSSFNGVLLILWMSMSFLLYSCK